jgi:RHS repeat-associated protein
LTSIYTGTASGDVSLTYTYTAGANNGKIASTTNNLTGEQVQYAYDSLNRLIQALATSHSWGQNFVYDGFGNLYQKNVAAGSAPSMQYTVNAATNQLTGNGLSYDLNGNVVTPPSGGTLTYDFLNRVVAMTGGVAYSYDASNRRVWKQNSSGQVYYLYGLDGENLGTYTPQLGGSPAQLSFTLASGQERDYFFGKKLFTTEDNVGSAASGGTFFPWGEQRTGSSSEQYGFATYWQDGESSLDYAWNRYYSSTLGRFVTPDPARNSMDPGNPQSYNRYSYVLNDPASNNDPTGLMLPSNPDLLTAEDCIADPELCEALDWEYGILPGAGTGIGFPGPEVWGPIVAAIAAWEVFEWSGGGGGMAPPLVITMSAVDECIYPMGTSTSPGMWTLEVKYQVLVDGLIPFGLGALGAANISKITESVNANFPVTAGGPWCTANATNCSSLGSLSPTGTFWDVLAGNGTATQSFLLNGSALPVVNYGGATSFKNTYNSIGQSISVGNGAITGSSKTRKCGTKKGDPPVD